MFGTRFNLKLYLSNKVYEKNFNEYKVYSISFFLIYSEINLFKFSS